MLAKGGGQRTRHRFCPKGIVSCFAWRQQRRTQISIFILARTRQYPGVARLDAQNTADRFEVERALLQRGMTRIAGVDEAGRGPLAGPVVAAAVGLPTG